jgi:hypothetical protein
MQQKTLRAINIFFARSVFPRNISTVAGQQNPNMKTIIVTHKY